MLASIREQSGGVYVGGDWWTFALINHTHSLQRGECVWVTCKQNGIQEAWCLKKLCCRSDLVSVIPSAASAPLNDLTHGFPRMLWHSPKICLLSLKHSFPLPSDFHEIKPYFWYCSGLAFFLKQPFYLLVFVFLPLYVTALSLSGSNDAGMHISKSSSTEPTPLTVSCRCVKNLLRCVQRKNQILVARGLREKKAATEWLQRRGEWVCLAVQTRVRWQNMAISGKLKRWIGIFLLQS